MMESFKHCQNIMDSKLNTNSKHCQQKLFVVCPLKVLSVADGLRLFGGFTESVLLSLSSATPSAASSRWQSPTATNMHWLYRHSSFNSRRTSKSLQSCKAELSVQDVTLNAPSTSTSLRFSPAAGADPGACSLRIWIRLHKVDFTLVIVYML